MKLKDVLALDFKQEIEAVIKVGEYTEESASEEINNYIVTDQIARYINDFIKYYMTRKKETGIWISGFYGSGKSYLAKVIGYLLENPVLMGVPARDLFKDRLKGLENRALLENAIEGLGRYKTKVVTFDLSGESITNTFYKQLLLNFLSSIGLTKDFIGFIEYQIMKTNLYDDFLKEAETLSEESWEKSRKNTWHAPQIIKKAWARVSNEEVEEIDYIIENVNNIIDTIDADGLVKELDAFLEMNNDYDRIVFIVDEVSEALDKDHIDISELRGTAQHLSENGQGKYWFIATAQEKLDNILSQKNISQNDINIITDRFQLKIHLSSAEVDKVIKERVLAKTEEGKKALREFYQKKNGVINALSSLSGNFNTSIDSVDEFIDYYPFFKYQMRLLKNFLYSVFQQAQAGGSERGMLVTVDRILKNEDFFDKEIGEFVTSYQLCDYGFPMPQSELEEKFNKARNDLADEGISVDGKNLMRTVFFLEKSEDLKRTVDNIVKAYNNDLTYVGELKPDFQKALQLLEEKNYVLEENQEYKITSDTEEKLMQEMNMITSSWEERIDIVRNVIKELPFITKASTNNVDGKTYPIAIQDEQENLLSRKKGEVSLVVYNVLNVDDDIERELEDIKDKYIELDEAVLIPEIKYKDEIDRLARKIFKYQQITSRYRNTTDDDIKNVVESFLTILNDKQKELQYLIEESYENSWLIYDFNEKKLDKNNIDSTIEEIETRMIDRTFEKRLRSRLGDKARQFLTADSKKLIEYCNDSQFAFFDSEGTFIGDNLRVVDEINQECQSKSGRTGSGLIDKFTTKPYGWEKEDITGTLSALMRAGKLKIKYEGSVYRDYNNKKVIAIFDSINRIKKAKFFTIMDEGLEPGIKQNIVDTLLRIDSKGYMRVNYNDNDFEVVNAVREVADKYIRDFSANKSECEPGIVDDSRDDLKILKSFAGRSIEDSNLKTEAKEFLANKDKYASAVKYIIQLEHFIKNKYKKYTIQAKFVEGVVAQLEHIEKNPLEGDLKEKIDQFNTLKEKGIVNHIDQLNEKYNQIRQVFNKMFEGYFNEYKKVCQKLLEVSENKKEEIERVSIEANRNLYNKLNNYIATCNDILEKDFDLDTDEPKEKNTNSTLKEIILGKELNETRINEVMNAVPEEKGTPEKVYNLSLPRQTNNLTYIKNKLQQIIDELDSEEYDSVKITLN